MSCECVDACSETTLDATSAEWTTLTTRLCKKQHGPSGITSPVNMSSTCEMSSGPFTLGLYGGFTCAASGESAQNNRQRSGDGGMCCDAIARSEQSAFRSGASAMDGTGRGNGPWKPWTVTAAYLALEEGLPIDVREPRVLHDLVCRRQHNKYGTTARMVCGRGMQLPPKSLEHATAPADGGRERTDLLLSARAAVAGRA